MSNNPIVGTKKYFNKLYSKYGELVCCPVCDCRPCDDNCRLGFTDEWEIAALTMALEDADPKPGSGKKT